MRNKYPIFIPTKGRYNPFSGTISMFKKHNVDFKIVIESQEYNKYLKIVDKSNIIVVPHKNEGLTVTRNWIWDYAEEQGYEKFWTFDDNIGRVYRWNRNRKLQVTDGTYLKVIEDFADRYDNLYIIGMNYTGFCGMTKMKYVFISEGEYLKIKMQEAYNKYKNAKKYKTNDNYDTNWVNYWLEYLILRNERNNLR
jgi:hypothetical protein